MQYCGDLSTVFSLQNSVGCSPTGHLQPFLASCSMSETGRVPGRASKDVEDIGYSPSKRLIVAMVSSGTSGKLSLLSENTTSSTFHCVACHLSSRQRTCTLTTNE